MTALQLTEATLAARLATTVIGRELILLPQVPSTNDLLRERAAAGAAEGLVAIADEQTAGRGRRQRRWDAPPGSALLCSVLLRPSIAATDSFLLTMLASVSLAEAVQAASGLAPLLKWPNDLLLGSPQAPRKAAGILVDLELSGPQLAYAVLGMGLNVSWHPAAEDVQFPATSIAAEGGSANRLDLAVALLTRLDANYVALQSGERASLIARWRALLHTLGKSVRVETGGETLLGVAEDVSDEGLLLVRDDAGMLHRVLSGDVSLRLQT